MVPNVHGARLPHTRLRVGLSDKRPPPGVYLNAAVRQRPLSE